MGMPSAEYWDGDGWLVKAYRKANKLKQEMANEGAWLQGAYFYEALSRISPILHAFAAKGVKPHPYMEKPYDFGQQNQKTDDERLEDGKNWMMAFAESFNQSFKKKRGEMNGDGCTGAENSG